MDINKIVPNKIDKLSQAKILNQNQNENLSIERERNRLNLKLNKENIDNLVDTLNSAAKSINEKVSFSFHEKTHRVIMKVMDKGTNEVIREIPPKEMIRLLEHMHDLIGMFVDESR